MKSCKLDQASSYASYLEHWLLQLVWNQGNNQETVFKFVHFREHFISYFIYFDINCLNTREDKFKDMNSLHVRMKYKKKKKIKYDIVLPKSNFPNSQIWGMWCKQLD